MASQLALMKAKQLQHLAFLTGLHSSGRKSDLVNYLATSLQQEFPPAKRRRVLSVDMGIRNLAFCVLDVPDASNIGKPDSIDSLHVRTWKRLDLLQQANVSTVGTTPEPEARKTTKRVQKKASQASSVPKDAFTPSVLSKTAFKITQDLLSYKPTTILIERQRFRSGGGSAIQEWTVRVNMLESMLWACLETHKNFHPAKAATASPSMHEVNPSRVARFWTADSDAELRPSEDMLEDCSASFDKISSSRKVDKAEKIAVVRSWLCGGASVSLQLSPGTQHIADSIKEPHSRRSRKTTGAKTEDIAKVETKLDDLADCLLQGAAWVRWERNRQAVWRSLQAHHDEIS